MIAYSTKIFRITFNASTHIKIYFIHNVKSKQLKIENEWNFIKSENLCANKLAINISCDSCSIMICKCTNEYVK